MKARDISMMPGEMLLTHIQPRHHVVQLYGQDRRLARNVGRYFSEGLKRGEAGLIVASQEHIGSFVQQLAHAGLDTATLQDHRQLLLLDAQRTLASFMIDGQPNARLFDRSVGSAVRALRGDTANGSLRAYGEMVGLLWQDGQFSAAMKLEELWNDLLKDTAFSLFCSYPIDVFDRGFHRCDVDAVMCSHTHMVPEGSSGDLESAVSRALDETTDLKARGWKPLYEKSEQPSWSASLRGEALILWIRESLSESADDILLRARAYFDAAQEQPA